MNDRFHSKLDGGDPAGDDLAPARPALPDEPPPGRLDLGDDWPAEPRRRISRRLRRLIALLVIAALVLTFAEWYHRASADPAYAAGNPATTDPQVAVTWHRSCGFAQVRVHVQPAHRMLPHRVMARVYLDGWQIARSPLPPDGTLVVKPPLPPHSGRHTISVTLRQRTHSSPELWSLRHVRTNCDIGGTNR